MWVSRGGGQTICGRSKESSSTNDHPLWHPKLCTRDAIESPALVALSPFALPLETLGPVLLARPRCVRAAAWARTRPTAGYLARCSLTRRALRGTRAGLRSPFMPTEAACFFGCVSQIPKVFHEARSASSCGVPGRARSSEALSSVECRRRHRMRPTRDWYGGDPAGRERHLHRSRGGRGGGKGCARREGGGAKG